MEDIMNISEAGESVKQEKQVVKVKTVYNIKDMLGNDNAKASDKQIAYIHSLLKQNDIKDVFLYSEWAYGVGKPAVDSAKYMKLIVAKELIDKLIKKEDVEFILDGKKATKIGVFSYVDSFVRKDKPYRMY